MAPELDTVLVVSRLVDKLGGPVISKFRRAAERLGEDLWVDLWALASFREVLSVLLFASVSLLSFISSSEPSESLPRLLSDSAVESGVTLGNRERQ